MKNIILLLCMFFSLIVKAQCLEKIKKQNTFFILSKKNDKFTKSGCSPNNIIPSCGYHFYKKNKEPFKYSFFYNKYPSLDHKYSDNGQRMVFKIDKSFIRRNKDIIITRDFMEKQGAQAMINLLDDDSSNKTIFIINTAETKNGKIVLREVKIDYVKGE